MGETFECFNPCFGGFFSKTLLPGLWCSKKKHVSILVLVDFSLKRVDDYFSVVIPQGFNPCFGGFFSKTALEFVG